MENALAYTTIPHQLQRALPSDERDKSGALSNPGNETTLHQWKDFFVVFQQTLEQHTHAWYSSELIICILASSNKEIASIFASWLLGLPYLISESGDVLPDDELHGCKIDLKRWQQFLVNSATLDHGAIVENECIIRDHRAAIQKVAEGEYLWNEQGTDNDLIRLRLTCSQYILALSHHGQSTEGGVKDMGLCTDTRRNEYEASSLTCFRSMVNSLVSRMISLEKMKGDYVKKANQHRDSEGNAKSNQARKVDSLGLDKIVKAGATKRRAEMLVHETRKLVVPKEEWRIASARVQEMKSAAKNKRVQQSTDKRTKLKTARDKRVRAGQRVVSVDNVKVVVPFVPLKYDKKVRISSLRLQLLIPFAIIQLQKRNISFTDADAKKITALLDKLRQWFRDVNRDAFELAGRDKTKEPPEVIDVLLDAADSEWDIAKVYDIISSKKRKRQ